MIYLSYLQGVESMDHSSTFLDIIFCCENNRGCRPSSVSQFMKLRNHTLSSLMSYQKTKSFPKLFIVGIRTPRGLTYFLITLELMVASKVPHDVGPLENELLQLGAN